MAKQTQDEWLEKEKGKMKRRRVRKRVKRKIECETIRQNRREERMAWHCIAWNEMEQKKEITKHFQVNDIEQQKALGSP